MDKITKKIRFFFRYTFFFFKKQFLIIILSALLSVGIYFLFPKILPALKLNKGSRIGIIGKYNLSNLPLEIQEKISFGLTSLNEDGSINPELASSWEAKNNNKEFIFTIKDNIFWHDKKPLTAKDINYNFNDVTTSVVDDKQIRFNLKDSFPIFPIIVSKPIFKTGLVGVGEYQVKTVEQNSQIVESINLSSNLSYRFFPNEKAAKTAFKLGEIDELHGITNIDELEKWNNVKITPQVNYHQFVGVFFDTQTPKFGSKSVRQSLAYAIKDRWEPSAFSPISLKSWAYNRDIKHYLYDLENAKNLLKKSGVDSNLIKTVELSTIPSLITTAEQIKTDWEALGIETKIKVIQNLDDGFEALLVTQEIPPDPDQYTLWHSTQEGNISHFKNPKVDKLLEDGRKISDQEERKDIYFDFQKSLAEELPAIFLYYPTSYNLSK